MSKNIYSSYSIARFLIRIKSFNIIIIFFRLAFDEDRVPDLRADIYLQDIHSISSLLKMYFRELPNPLLTYQLYDKFAVSRLQLHVFHLNTHVIRCL